MSRIPRIAFALVLSVAVLLVAGALGHGQHVLGARAQVESDTFVGKLDGMDAFIGIGSDGFSVTAYICDGANNSLGDNFQGTIDQASDGVLSLQADNGDTLFINADATTLPGLLVPDGAITVALNTSDGNSYTFSTEAAVSPGGLYLSDSQSLADGSTGDGGWVVLNDGEVRGSFSLQGPGVPRPTDFGHSGVLGQGLQFAPAVVPQLATTQLNAFGQNLNQVFLRGGGPLTLPVIQVVNQPVVLILQVVRFIGRT